MAQQESLDKRILGFLNIRRDAPLTPEREELLAHISLAEKLWENLPRRERRAMLIALPEEEVLLVIGTVSLYRQNWLKEPQQRARELLENGNEWLPGLREQYQASLERISKGEII